MLNENSFKNAKTALLLGSYTSTKDKSASEDNLSELERLCDTYGLEAVAKVGYLPLKKSMQELI